MAVEGPPKIWRRIPQFYRLEGDYNPITDTVAFPPGPNRPRFSLGNNGDERAVETDVLNLPEMTVDDITSIDGNGNGDEGANIVADSGVIFASKNHQ